MTNPAFTRRACLRALSGLLAAAAFSRAAHAADPKKMIVLYFSWSGSTQKVAEEIQRLTGCDIARIETVTPYPRDYSETVKIAVPEREGKARPIPASKIRICPGRRSSTFQQAAEADSGTASRRLQGSSPKQRFSPAIRFTAGEA